MNIEYRIVRRYVFINNDAFTFFAWYRNLIRINPSFFSLVYVATTYGGKLSQVEVCFRALNARGPHHV